jgi:hypothetical protein
MKAMFFDNSPHGRLVVSQVESHGQLIRRIKIETCSECGARLRRLESGLCDKCVVDLINNEREDEN